LPGTLRRDSGANTDYRGDTVTYANIIYRELGLPEQNSYIAYNSTGIIPTLGFQYTNGAVIDRSVVLPVVEKVPGDKDKYHYDWDSSSAGNSNDLLIGNTLPNELRAGDGNDYLYGNGNDDTLYGGTGANYLDGGIGVDTYHITSDGKTDTIVDADGLGSIRLDGELLSGGEAVLFANGMVANIWTSADGSITYRSDGVNLEVIKNGSIEIRILNYDFTNDALSLNLTSAAGAPDYTSMHTIGASTYDQVLLSNDVRSVSTGGMMDSVILTFSKV
jgi:Ca2+-binding RTX toxin-like protein